MYKRSVNKRFRAPVMADIKTTTMRDKPWPVGVPIMLYSWLDKPYRSKHDDLAPVIVEKVSSAEIQRKGDTMSYEIPDGLLDRPLWQCEGFDSKDDMDEWFRAVVKDGQTKTRSLMVFRVINGN